MTKHESASEAVSGFSAIELLVVIALGGILVSIAWARMSDLVPIYRLEGAARNLATNLQKARGRAIAENKCFQVAFNANMFQVVWSDSSACGTFPRTEAAQHIDDANSITMAATANPVFPPRGTVSTPSVITLTNSVGAVRTVFVQSTGRVHVQ